jgi:hypothetical protein
VEEVPVNILQYLNGLRPALPLSREKPITKEKPASPPSNGELRRWIRDGSVVINGERWQPEEEMPPMVWSLIFFPKSAKSRTTLI